MLHQWYPKVTFAILILDNEDCEVKSPLCTENLNEVNITKTLDMHDVALQQDRLDEVLDGHILHAETNHTPDKYSIARAYPAIDSENNTPILCEQNSRLTSSLVPCDISSVSIKFDEKVTPRILKVLDVKNYPKRLRLINNNYFAAKPASRTSFSAFELLKPMQIGGDSPESIVSHRVNFEGSVELLLKSGQIGREDLWKVYDTADTWGEKQNLVESYFIGLGYDSAYHAIAKVCPYSAFIKKLNENDLECLSEVSSNEIDSYEHAIIVPNAYDMDGVLVGTKRLHTLPNSFEMDDALVETEMLDQLPNAYEMDGALVETEIEDPLPNTYEMDDSLVATEAEDPECLLFEVPETVERKQTNDTPQCDAHLSPCRDIEMKTNGLLSEIWFEPPSCRLRQKTTFGKLTNSAPVNRKTKRAKSKVLVQDESVLSLGKKNVGRLRSKTLQVGSPLFARNAKIASSVGTPSKHGKFPEVVPSSVKMKRGK